MRALLIFWCLTLQASIPVWIDTDPSMAPGGHEIDDGFAWIQAFHSKEIAVRGVSLVFGNAPLDQATLIAREFLPLIAPRLHAIPGAASSAELGMETAASQAIEAALRKQKLTILALGPVTNVATVLKNHPDLAARIVRIVAVAGRRPGQHFITGTKGGRPLRDFNFEKDAPAFQVLLDSGVPITLAPWEISSTVWLRSEDVTRFQAGGAALQWMSKPASDWLTLWQRNFGVDGFNPFDTLAVAAVTSPNLIQCEDLPVQIRQLPDDAQEAASKPYLLAGSEVSSQRKVHYCHDAKPQFKDDLMKRLLRK